MPRISNVSNDLHYEVFLSRFLCDPEQYTAYRVRIVYGTAVP